MPQLIAAPTLIPVPGNKIIEEYIGRVNSGDAQASIARMRSPAGWSEPHEGGVTDVAAGQGNYRTERRMGSLQHATRRRVRRHMRARVLAGNGASRPITGGSRAPV